MALGGCLSQLAAAPDPPTSIHTCLTPFIHLARQGLCTRVAEATSQSVPLSVRFYGKPNPEPYAMAEQLLLQQAAELGIITCSSDSSSSSSGRGSMANSSAKGGEASERLPQLPFSSIFAVGDNPAADVRGANARGPPWVSVLVQTGRWSRWCGTAVQYGADRRVLLQVLQRRTHVMDFHTCPSCMLRVLCRCVSGPRA